MDYPFAYSILKTGLPLIVTSGSPSFCFLLDTGSTHNLLFDFVYEALEAKFSKLRDTFKIMGIIGEPKVTFQIKGSIDIENCPFNVIFEVIETPLSIAQIQHETGVQIHGILGIPFLKRHGWILDFKELKLIS